MYLLHVLASLHYLIKYTRQPLQNRAGNWQWGVLMLAKMLKVKNDMQFINNLLLVVGLNCFTFIIVLFVISPSLSDDFIRNTEEQFKMINAAIILSFL